MPVSGRMLGLAMTMALMGVADPAAAQEAAVTEAGAPPSAAALALAHLIGPAGMVGMHAPDSVEEVTKNIADRLLSAQLAWRGPGCDRNNAECSAIAEKMAREEAPGMLAARREAGATFLAYLIDSRMTADEIAAATTTARSPGGQSLVKLLATVDNPRMFPPAVAKLLPQLMGASMADSRLRDRFFDATRHLPRTASLPVPPPPIAPTRPRNVQ
jgi:hypothetical protein